MEQARCICRSVIDRGVFSATTCCNNFPAARFDKLNGTAQGFATGSKHRARSYHHHRRCGDHHHHPGGGRIGIIRKPNAKSAHGYGHDHDTIEPAQGQGGNCSADHDHVRHYHSETNFEFQNFDVEKVEGFDIISIAISGMDCTSCGDKLNRVFLATHGVTQARVNFIAGRGDLVIDTSKTTADQVVRSASTGSGFRLTLMVGGDYFFDVLASGPMANALMCYPPRGVTNAIAIDRKTLRLAYDPTVAGAREIFNALQDRTGGLAPPCADPQLESSHRRLWDQLVKTVLAAIFTIPIVTLSWGEDLTARKTKAVVSLILGTLVQIIAVPEFYRPALSTLWYSRTVEMDMLVVISITAAFLYSLVAFGFSMADKPLDTPEFFETSTLLITLILLGRLIATIARVRAVAAVSIRSLQINTAVLSENGKDHEIDARLLQYGDHFRVLPHSRVPTDGTVLFGKTEIDESMLTGESLPVLKQPGNQVVAGTVNGDGTIVVQLDRLPGKNTVTDIAQLVDEAANSKPKIQDLADKAAGYFVPVVSSIALTAFVIWIVVGLRVNNNPTDKAVVNAITYLVAVLAVACPCALGLAVPMVLVVSGGIAARGGVIIKSAETTERVRKTTDVVFDKTGTITESDLVVIEQKYLSAHQDRTTILAKALVAGGKHPVSAAVAKHLDGQAIKDVDGLFAEVTEISVIPGAGVEGRFQGAILRAGHPRWTKVETHPTVVCLQEAGLTTMVVTLDSAPLVIYGLRTRIRPEAASIIAELKSRKINLHLVSGDQTFAVQAVAATLGIPPDNVAAQRTPAEKRDYVASLMEDPSKYVIFCGDGTNDAVAVAQANVGVQIGGGLSSSDVTQSAADVILLRGLEGIPFMLNVGKASFNRMVFNFVWSAIYNFLAITMASGAWVKFRIPPAYAGLGELVSVLPVIFASLSMLLLTLNHKAKANF